MGGETTVTTSTHPHGAQRAEVLLAFAAIYVIWGSTYLAIRFAIETVPPLLMAAARFLIAGGALYAWLRWRGAARPAAIHWRAAALVGGFLLLGGNGAVVWAEQRVPSGVTALLVAMVPRWMVLIDWARPGGVRPTLMVAAGLVARRRGYSGVASKRTLRDFGRDLLAALPALGMPVFILGAILSGFATATEAAALSVVYALVAGLLIYRELTLAEIHEALVETVSGTGAVMLIMALATPFAWILTVEQVPVMAKDLIEHVGAGPLGTVALVLLILLFVGTFLDLGPAMIVLAPILAPVLVEAGLAPYQIGVLFTVALGIGLYTPPVGTNLFVVCNVGHVSIAAVSRELVPFWLASALVLVLLVVFPGLSEWLPGLFGKS